MSKTGGAATLSSFRVQKAFSINFRENKRLYAQLKLIENEHIRMIRQVKQDITETKLWLEGVQQTTGDSDKAINPDIDSRSSSRQERRSRTMSRTSDVEQKAEKALAKVSSEAQLYGRGEAINSSAMNAPVIPPQHVRFSQSVEGKRPIHIPDAVQVPPQTAPVNKRSSFESPFGRRQEPIREVNEQSISGTPRDEDVPVAELYGESSSKSRVHSAASRNSNQSLTAYQRRRQLKSLILKKRNPLEIKKEMNAKECSKVDDKVAQYILNISDKLSINLPNLDEMDIEKHNTPFAQDANLT